uniref:(northern house mosquito) hypothetical protein n=1 Tax=Culex pipiens TaxID=7175 RepID=A0A8D8JSM6_CULPI
MHSTTRVDPALRELMSLETISRGADGWTLLTLLSTLISLSLLLDFLSLIGSATSTYPCGYLGCSARQTSCFRLSSTATGFRKNCCTVVRRSFVSEKAAPS